MPAPLNPIQALYNGLLKHILFGLDAELAHDLAVKSLGTLDRVPAFSELAARPFFQINDPRLIVKFRDLSFSNPVGLAAGFDKNAELLGVLPDFGFGFIEVGTFTPLPQEGQKKPRLFRLKQDRALLNRMGFNNPGVKMAAQRLRENLEAGRKCPIGVNIGKGRDTPIEEAAEDYLAGFENVHPYADFIVLNVSSPNTPNLRSLQRQNHLAVVLKHVVDRNKQLAEQAGQAPKSIFTKVSPDCSDEELDDICQLAVDFNVGLVATNTTIDYSLISKTNHQLMGGVSGKPILKKSNEVLRKIRAATKGIVPLIGVGGVFSAEDAYEKIRLGASLVQVYTGWIYEGPSLVPDINTGLLKLLERDGFKTIQEAVGTR
jgi:dihydroorotate dehydrogenase